MKKKSLSFLREVIIVLIGVIAALFINDWKEDSNNKKYIQSVLTSVNSDMKRTQSSVQEVMDKHIVAIDSIVHYMKDEDQSIRTILERVGGVKYPSIQNTSLKYLIAGRADLIEYELIALTTDIETHAQLMDKKFEKLMDYTYEKMEATDNESKMIFAIHLTNVIDSETQLLDLYQEFSEVKAKSK